MRCVFVGGIVVDVLFVAVPERLCWRDLRACRNEGRGVHVYGSSSERCACRVR